MANEITTSVGTEIIYGEWINPTFQAAALDHVVATQLCLSRVPGNNSATVAFPKRPATTTADDAGVSVDTEYDYTEAASLSNVAFNPTDTTITAGAYAIKRNPTDFMLEDQAPGFDIMSEIVLDAADVLTLAAEFDCCATFTSFTTTKGTTTVDLSLANMIDAVSAARRSGARAVPGGMAYVLDSQQAEDFQTALSAVGTSMAQFAGAANDLLRFRADEGNGMLNGIVASFMGYEVRTTGVCSTANAGADVVGALLIRGDVAAQERFASIGRVDKRMLTVEMQRDVDTLSTKVVSSMRQGFGMLAAAFGAKIVTDA